jgi:hypothetical protein
LQIKRILAITCAARPPSVATTEAIRTVDGIYFAFLSLAHRTLVQGNSSDRCSVWWAGTQEQYSSHRNMHRSPTTPAKDLSHVFCNASCLGGETSLCPTPRGAWWTHNHFVVHLRYAVRHYPEQIVLAALIRRHLPRVVGPSSFPMHGAVGIDTKRVDGWRGEHKVCYTV